MNAVQKIHVKPNNNWMNDPNGFIYHKGAYHLFYQCFPYSARWGRMHWNHMISKDLVHWEDLGIALFPSKMTEAAVFQEALLKRMGNYIYIIRESIMSWKIRRTLTFVWMSSLCLHR